MRLDDLGEVRQVVGVDAIGLPGTVRQGRCSQAPVGPGEGLHPAQLVEGQLFIAAGGFQDDEFGFVLLEKFLPVRQSPGGC